MSHLFNRQGLQRRHSISGRAQHIAHRSREGRQLQPLTSRRQGEVLHTQGTSASCRLMLCTHKLTVLTSHRAQARGSGGSTFEHQHSTCNLLQQLLCSHSLPVVLVRLRTELALHIDRTQFDTHRRSPGVHPAASECPVDDEVCWQVCSIAVCQRVSWASPSKYVWQDLCMQHIYVYVAPLWHTKAQGCWACFNI